MIERTLVFVFLIFLGVLLQRKIKDGRELQGLKLIILSIALPATIFVALLSVRFDVNYLYLPAGALIFNLVMLGLMQLSAPIFNLIRRSEEYRTIMMLFPSLAPGLSCFPFLSEYLGEEGLAFGAMADVGNKVFVLIILYMLAIHWFQDSSNSIGTSSGKLKSLFMSMINEPINMVIIVALLMVAFGWNLDNLPEFLGQGISRAAMIMTPLVLLFIGLSVRIKWRDFRRLFFILTYRSGMAFLLSALMLAVLPDLTMAMMMLIIVFPQSSASFWPYAHMSAVNQMGDRSLFDTKLAISFLACSLPYSTISIVGAFSFTSYFTRPGFLFAIGGGMVLFALLPWVRDRLLIVRTTPMEHDTGDPLPANG